MRGVSMTLAILVAILGALGLAIGLADTSAASGFYIAYCGGMVAFSVLWLHIIKTRY